MLISMAEMRGSFELSNQLYLLAEFLNICQLDMLMGDSDKAVAPASVCAERPLGRRGSGGTDGRGQGQPAAALQAAARLAEARQMENLRRKTMSSCSGMGLPKK